MTAKKLTLGSLFDGSGGFPLGAVLTGIQPIWASEVEPFPIRVTTKRLPFMKHFGDINNINGSLIPPVDIITAGFCCQDLSVAGKRAGLQGERSGLFFQIPRIIKEMFAATDNQYPKYVVLENVPGMYSSNNGLDFQEVLNELIHIKDETLSVPLPKNGRWLASGLIVGDGFSIGWRTLDAQFWGVAQRRRRCFIVIDFTGERAREILFDETRLRGHPPQGGFPWQAAAGCSKACAGSAVCLNDQGGKRIDISEDVTGTLRSQEHGHQPIVFEPGAASRVGSHVWQGGPAGTLRADMGDNQLAVVYDARGNGNGEVTNTITGDHNNRITDYTALAVEPVIMKIRAGCEGGGKGALIQDNLSATLSCHNDQTIFVPKIEEGKAVVERVAVENYQHSGYRESKVSGTLAASGGTNGGGSECLLVENKYVVRRLTPIECARLQGFPDWWCSGLETEEPTEEDIAFWSNVWETDRLIKGKSSKPKTRNQIMKWLKDPHSDSAEYMMWGNGVALPCVVFVLGGIATGTQG